MDALERLLSFRLRVGRVARVDVYLHWTLLIAVALLLYLLPDFKLGLLVVMTLVASVLLHELGHCWGARKVGGEAREVILWPLGGLAMIRAPMAPLPQFVATVTGPLVNLLLLLAFLPLFLLLGGEAGWLSPVAPLPGAEAGRGLLFLCCVVRINLVLLVFNLIPAFPMDGGRLLHSALWPRLGFHRAMNVAIVAAFVCAGLMVLLGFKIKDPLLVLVGLFVVVGAMHQRNQLRIGLHEEELAMNAPWAANLPTYSQQTGEEPEPAASSPSKISQWREKRRRTREADLARRKVELRERLDEVLEKVSAKGLDNLSREEKRFLDYASAELRKEQQRS